MTCIVQARTGSSRLPGKVLAELGGRPMLRFQLERLLADPPGTVVVATTRAASDDAIAELAHTIGVPCVRGSEPDVLERFVEALNAFPADTVIRLTGDCPLSDPAIVRDALVLHAGSGADYVSNTLVRTYPDGLDVEVMTADVLRAAAIEATDAAEREHVTPFVYRHPERFTLRTLRTSDLLGDERWTVDTPDDLEYLRAIVDRLGSSPAFGWRDFLAVAGRRAVAAAGVVHLRPATEGDSAFVLALRNDDDAVRFSGSGAAVDEVAHDAWYRRVLNDPSRRLWVAELNGIRVGQVRVDVVDATGTVSIAVAGEARGRGVAQAMLQQLDVALAADLQVRGLVAEVHRDNPASRRAFERAGYTLAAERGPFLVFTHLR